MEKLTIVTFISNNESPNLNLFSLLNTLNTAVKNIKMIIYTDIDINIDSFQNKSVDITICPGTTKYKRILMSFMNAKTENILYIDNDITPDNDNLLKLISGFNDNTDIAWGYIGVTEINGFIPNLIAIDKLLSHKIIRPLLWKFGIGISVPGQVFLINTSKFRNDLPSYDTVFDDLTIGIITKQFNYSVSCLPLYLGYEKPSSAFSTLVMQRKHWAKGFYQSICNNIHDKILPYILLHGLVYHFLWLPVWIIIVFAGLFSIPLGVIIFIIVCSCLCNRKFLRIGYSFAYAVVFPFIHLIWFFTLIYNILIEIGQTKE